MFQKRPIYRVLGCLILLPIVCIGVLWVYRFTYTDLGRITQFAPLSEGNIPGTNNFFRDQRDNLTLKHTIIQVDQQTDTNRILISGYSPEYTTLEHNNKTYTIIRMLGDSANGLYKYIVVLPDSRLLDGVYACSNPKLSNNSLEFYDPTVNRNNCDWFPFDWREFPIFEIKLD